MTDELPPLPEPVEVLELWGNDCPVYNREQMRAYATAYARAAVLAERERWIGGVRVQIPTEAMEQEIQAHVRRAVAAERERCARICESVNNHDNPMTARDCADAIRKGTP